MGVLKLLSIFCISLLAGCSAVEHVGIAVLYRRAALPDSQITRDIPYVDGSTSPKHRLDLFRPKGNGWPTYVFIHGGSWNSGDKSLTAAGEDVYGNIGRYFAARGIGVAVINYRLLPDVTWREQMDDAARAVAWVGKSIKQYGGDPARIFVGGHSAGAHIGSYVALNSTLAKKHKLPLLAGAICISGAAYDMTDPVTYQLGNQPSFYAERFAEKGGNPDWQRNASSAFYAKKGAPPFLILVAEGDSAPLRRQAKNFHEILIRRGVTSRLVTVPGESHIRIVLALTSDDKVPGPEMEKFLLNTRR
jgi:acetyl esterase/lipase